MAKTSLEINLFRMAVCIFRDAATQSEGKPTKILKSNRQHNLWGSEKQFSKVSSTEKENMPSNALLLHGVDIVTTDIAGRTALHLAAKYGHALCLQKLLQYNCSTENATSVRARGPGEQHG
ncbi:hypothetical protein L345_08080, partial [Ophiophagus hannah]